MSFGPGLTQQTEAGVLGQRSVGSSLHTSACTRLPAHVCQLLPPFHHDQGVLWWRRGREVGLTTTEYKGWQLCRPPTHFLRVKLLTFSPALTALRDSPFILYWSQISCLSVSLSPFFFSQKSSDINCSYGGQEQAPCCLLSARWQVLFF